MSAAGHKVITKFMSNLAAGSVSCAWVQDTGLVQQLLLCDVDSAIAICSPTQWQTEGHTQPEAIMVWMLDKNILSTCIGNYLDSFKLGFPL